VRAVVVGAGAMGSIYGAMLHDAGHEVAFLEASPVVVTAIGQQGLVIARRDGSVDSYHIPASTDARTLDGPVDLLLIQVKGFATAAAAEGARALVGPDTVLLTLQNGLGNEEVLRAAFPDNRLLIGVSVHSVAVTAPGRYSHTGVRGTHLGPADERWFDVAEQVGRWFDGCGYDTHVEHASAIRREIYGKWVLNCGSLPTLAITGLPTEAVQRLELVLRHCDALTREACELAALEGVTLDAGERTAFNRELFRSAGGKASMLQDIEAGRRTEIDTINGAAVRIADRHGHPAPLNRAMVALIKGREAALGIGS
jgi:2-dehydropantoate 2-reductase